MSIFTRRKQTIKAIRWNGYNLYEVFDFLEEDIPQGVTAEEHDRFIELETTYRLCGLPLLTEDGYRRVPIGWYIIEKTNGDYVTCSPGTFREEFEEVRT